MTPDRKPEQLSFLEATPPVEAAPRKTAGAARDAFAGVQAQDLPESLQRLCELLGLPKVIHLVRTYGGTRLHVHKDPAWDHPLCRVLGRAPARLLGQHYGGETLYIPSLSRVRRGARDRRIRRDYDGGMPARELATREGLSYRQIAGILNTPEDPES